VKGEILFFGGVEWDWLWQRYQEIVTRLGKRGWKILYVEPVGVRKPRLSSFDLKRIRKRLFRFLKGVKEVAPGVWLFSPLLFPFPSFEKINGWLLLFFLKKIKKKLGFKNSFLWLSYPSPLFLKIKEKTKSPLLVYDCVDDYSTVKGIFPGVKEVEEELIKETDLLLVVSKNLLEKKKGKKEVYHIPNGVNFKLFSSPFPSPEILSLPSPRLGFAGGIEWWVDISLLEYIAQKFPRGSLILIGPSREKYPRLFSLPNVHWVGKKEHTLLPSFLKALDVCILPFKRTSRLLSADPIILYEYLALGKPVVSTDFPRARDFSPPVKIARTREEFVEKIEESLGCGEEEEVKKLARENDWEKRVEKIEDLLIKKLT